MRSLRRDWARAGGHVVREERPTKPKTKRGPAPRPVDPDALAEALAELEKKASQPRRSLRGGNTLPATGHCHDCNRPVSGERRYCGPCLAKP